MSSPSADPSSAQPSYLGWEYQITVSVWLALEFILIKGANQVEIEPLSEEDLSASFEVRSETPTLVKLENFQIQIKLRNNVLWDKSSFEGLLKPKQKNGTRGPAPRTRPLEYLQKDQDLRFILVTNAGVDRELRPFEISEIGANSSATRFLTIDGSSEVTRRIGILASKAFSELELKIDALLQAYCHVPSQKLKLCRDALISAVREKLLGRSPRLLNRSEIETIVTSHEGSFTTSQAPVEPANMSLIRERVAEAHAIILIGPPGTGKTTLAKFIYEELTSGNPPFQLHPVTSFEKLAAVRAVLNEPGSTVFYFEDPWGHNSPGSLAESITVELPKLLRLATRGKKFVVTTTMGVFQQATVDNPKAFDEWLQFLNPEDYPDQAREHIYERQIALWSEAKREAAMGFREEVLARLETPYSIEIFCRQVGEILDERKIHSPELRRLADDSNVAAFATRLAAWIRARGESSIKAAMVIWALSVVAANIISENEVTHSRELLIIGGSSNPPAMLSFFEALARSWLQKRSTGYLLTPTVKAALETFRSTDPDEFGDTIGALFKGWSLSAVWGSIHRCVRELKSASLVPSEIVSSFDDYLITVALTSNGYAFRYAFEELGRFSKGHAPPALLAQFLSTRTQTSGYTFYPGRGLKWRPAVLSVPQCEAIGNDERAQRSAERFVMDCLPHDYGVWHGHETFDPSEIVHFLSSFNWPVEEWFHAAFYQGLRDPEESLPYLLRCLLVLGDESLDALIEECIQCVDSNAQPWTDEEREENRKVEQGEKGADHYEPDDPRWASHGYASNALQVALKRKIELVGYDWISSHLEVKILTAAWVEIAATPVSDLSERQALVECCEGIGAREQAAKAVCVGLEPCFYPWAIQALLQLEGKISGSLLPVLLTFARDPEFLVQLEATAGDRARSALALLGFVAARNNFPGKPSREVPDFESLKWFKGFVDLESRFNASERSALIACCRAKEPCPADGLECEPEFLRVLSLNWPAACGILALEVLERGGIDVADLLERFLESENSAVRARAWSICDSREQLIGVGLADEDYHCRIAAMNRVAPDASSQEWEHLLRLRTDPSAYVRENLAELIGKFRIGSGIPTLIALLSDPHDYGGHQGPDDCDRFEVARKAASALLELHAVAESHLGDILNFLAACQAATPDSLVHVRLFKLLARFPSSEVAEFCNDYLNRIWGAAKWNTGRAVVEQCAISISAILNEESALLPLFDLSGIAHVCMCRGDNSWLVSAATTLVGLGSESATIDFPAIFASEHLSERRARLLAALSPDLRSNSSFVSEHLTDKDSFLEFLRWSMERPHDYGQFKADHPDFHDWITSEGNSDDFGNSLHWAVSRLIAQTDATPLTESLPGNSI